MVLYTTFSCNERLEECKETERDACQTMLGTKDSEYKKLQNEFNKELLQKEQEKNIVS